MAHDPTSTDPELLCPSERKVLADYWRSRGQGEMGAERFFVRLIDDLQVLGSPQPLVDLAMRGREDERRHGLWGRDWAVFFGHEDESEPVAKRTQELRFPGASARENRILRFVFAAMTETHGCHVLTDIRARIRYAPLRENNREHLADEVMHARLCWGFLSTLGDKDRTMVRQFLPVLLQILPAAVCEGPESDEFEHLVPWGYLTPRVLRAAHERALREVILPAFSHLNIANIQEAA